MKKSVRKKPIIMLFATAAVLSVVGCGGKSATEQADENKRTEDAKGSMTRALAEDPTLKKPSDATKGTPHAAPPGAPMGSYH